VPKADTCASSESPCEVNSFCWPAPKALVSDDTMALMSSPDPIPVDVMAALLAGAAGGVVAAVDAAPEIVELICMRVPSQMAY
jgi:hypothetical protein